MPTFEYEAVTLTGERTTGTLDAPSREHAHDALRREGKYPRSITEKTEKKRERAVRPLGNNELAVLLAQFASLLESGIPFMRCLEIIAQHAGKQRERELLAAVHEDVQRGSSLSTALDNAGGAFPQLLVQTVRAGEMGSSLTQSLRAMAVHYEKRHALMERVRGAVTYPCIVIVVAVLIVGFLMTNVIPTFSRLFEQSGAQLPVVTRVLLGVGTFMGDNLLALLLAAALLALAGRAAARNDKVRLFISGKLINVRVIGRIVRYTNASLYARTLGTLMTAGVSFVDAMSMSGKVLTNAYIRSTLPAMEAAVKQGATLHAALEEAGWAPDILLSMVALGEESGMLEEMLTRAGDQMDGESGAAIARAAALIEPGIMIVMGVAVAFIVLAVLMPMFTLSNAIGF